MVNRYLPNAREARGEIEQDTRPPRQARHRPGVWPLYRTEAPTVAWRSAASSGQGL